MQCKCQWIDGNGVTTPDTNEAIAMAVCHDPSYDDGHKGSCAFPICREHAKSRGKFWKLYPLPGKTVEESDIEVRCDDKIFKIIPKEVSEAIKKKFPNDFWNIFKVISPCFDYFGFEFKGIYYGVEKDGYIHT